MEQNMIDESIDYVLDKIRILELQIGELVEKHQDAYTGPKIKEIVTLHTILAVLKKAKADEAERVINEQHRS